MVVQTQISLNTTGHGHMTDITGERSEHECNAPHQLTVDALGAPISEEDEQISCPNRPITIEVGIRSYLGMR